MNLVMLQQQTQQQQQQPRIASKRKRESGTYKYNTKRYATSCFYFNVATLFLLLLLLVLMMMMFHACPCVCVWIVNLKSINRTSSTKTINNYQIQDCRLADVCAKWLFAFRLLLFIPFSLSFFSLSVYLFFGPTFDNYFTSQFA